MSYRLQSKCFLCKLRECCNDRDLLYGAISKIDIMPRLHYGSGIIILDCRNFEEETEVNPGQGVNGCAG